MFGLQPLNTSIGGTGEGIGFQGVQPSIGIEFDTWQNNNLSDPAYDHIAIIKNGNLNHTSVHNLAGPVPAMVSGSNIEDCQRHKLRVNWDAPKQVLEIWFDCSLRLSYKGNIVMDIFGGDPWVYWGFTSATGGARNLHQICFSYTTFLDGFKDVVICPGGQFQLKVSGGVKYKWTPETGLSNPNIPNPVAAPKETTTYLVEVTDACNIPFYDSLTVFIDGDTVFFELGSDTTICESSTYQLDATSYGIDTVTYLWSNGAITPTISQPASGLWSVTVTVDKYCVADDRVNITLQPAPKVSLPTDTVLCLEQTLELNVLQQINQSYTWHNGQKGPVFTVSGPGDYSVIASNICGTAEASINVGYRDCRKVFMPNVFSPNGDGINDTFFPFAGGNIERILHFQIFNRWGTRMFKIENIVAEEMFASWDGRTPEQIAPDGVYAWYAEVKFIDGTLELLKGDVLLLR
jgi:gliding motility-associated-like protein